MDNTAPIYGLSSENILSRIRSGNITIDLVGIGNMGLPLAVAFADEGINSNPSGMGVLSYDKTPPVIPCLSLSTHADNKRIKRIAVSRIEIVILFIRYPRFVFIAFHLISTIVQFSDE